MCAKVEEVCEVAMSAVDEKNMCVVIGLQTTGAATLDQAIENGCDLSVGLDSPVSVAEAILLRVVNTLRHKDLRGDHAAHVALADQLESEVLELGLPPSVLDDVIDRLGK